MKMQHKVDQAFKSEFGTQPSFCVRAPGRVNLIGEHTDYNDGFVLPMAIDRHVWIALRPRPDRLVRIHSLQYDQAVEFSLDDLQKGEGWGEYPKGIAWAMQKEGLKLNGWEGVLTGDVPRGSGLASSAAVEMAAVLAFTAVPDLVLAPTKMARLGQKAENQWIGVNSGIMDQMASAAATSGHALFLDCSSLAYRHIPLPLDVEVVVMDTGTRRGLVDSTYNERRSQCESAARIFGVHALRDVTLETFRSRAAELEPLVRRRAWHVVSENRRVLEAVDAMQRSDLIGLGKLLDASHASLRDDFEVSSSELNTMVGIARAEPGCYGARMTGAGFGGCAVALVRLGTAQQFTASVAEKYRLETGLKPDIFVSHAVAGASVEEI